MGLLGGFKPKQVQKGHLFFWAASGPLCLFAAFSVLLFRTSLDLWPFTALASAGLIATWVFKQKGFYLSFLAMLGIAIANYTVILDQPWCAFFLAATALSWGIVLLGQEEIFRWVADVQKGSGALHQAQLEIAQEKQYLDQALSAQSEAMQQQKEKLESLAEEIQGYQRKEKAFQVALEDAQAQILKYKYAEAPKPAPVANPILSEESIEGNGDVQQELRQLEFQHALLKEQFDEKAEALSKARKELFQLESKLAVLQKESDEKMTEVSAEELALQALTNECQDLEAQVNAMEEIITGLLAAKKAPAKPRKTKPKAKQALLPEILQGAIDQKNNQFSLLE